MFHYLSVKIFIKSAFWVHFALLALVLPPFISATMAASGKVELCNRTSYVLDAATALQDGNASQSKGWVRIMPGSCATGPQVSKGDARLYVYARSVAAHIGKTQNFSGSERFCVMPKADFDINGRRECRMRGYASAEFALADLSTTKNRVYFTEPYDFNVKRSQIAGVQRLLRDIGYEIGLVDGFTGRRTRNSMTDFQKKNNLPVTNAVSKDLLAKLLETAKRESAERGLKLCNDTGDLIWAAIGFVNKESFTTQGWLRIASKECIQAINQPLYDRYYFVYAEAVDEKGQPLISGGKRRVWNGNFNLCTKPTRFSIESHNDCADKGFEKTGFMKLDTGQEKKWIMRFE